MEDVVHGVFLLLGLVTVGCVLLITVYLILSGLPAITKIGLGKFLFGSEWASTAAEAKFGILPFILTSVYGTCGAILIGVPVGFVNVVQSKELIMSSDVPYIVARGRKGGSAGHAPNYMEVSVAQEGLHNQVKNVKITAVDGGSLRGELEE